MILTPHAVVGAALTNMFPNDPVLGFSIAFLSHFALDAIPHYQYDISKFLDEDTKSVKSILKDAGSAMHFLFIVFDLVVALSLCFLIFIKNRQSAMITLIGVIGGLLPDFLLFIYYKYKYDPVIFLRERHEKIQSHINGDSDETVWIKSLQFILPIVILIIYFFFTK